VWRDVGETKAFTEGFDTADLKGRQSAARGVKISGQSCEGTLRKIGQANLEPNVPSRNPETSPHFWPTAQ